MITVLNENLYFNKALESGTSRIYAHLTNTDNLAIISPYRAENDDSKNKSRMNEMKSIVRNDLKLGFSQFISRWVEDGESFDEESLMIYNISFEDAFALSQKYHQSSFIYKKEKSCEEICTTEFSDGNKTYKPGDVVRTFNINGDSILNIKDAEAIFSKRKGGPASMPIKSNRPFTLKTVEEVIEVIQPSPSTFSGYKHNRIF